MRWLKSRSKKTTKLTNQCRRRKRLHDYGSTTNKPLVCCGPKETHDLIVFMGTHLPVEKMNDYAKR